MKPVPPPFPAAVVTAWVLPAPGAPSVWGWALPERLRREWPAQVGPAVCAAEAPPAPGALVLVRGDLVCHGSVLRGLAQAPGVALADEDGHPAAVHLPAGHDEEQRTAARAWLDGVGPRPSGCRPVRADAIAPAYNETLRKREDSYCLVATGANLAALERRIFLGTYKGVVDAITKYVWPTPALIVTKWCVRAGVTPNMVTWLGAALMLAALGLFFEGRFGLGLALGWIMTFLDTVDGKLARVSLNSSRFGNALDHGIDLLHPPFWYVAWGYGLGKLGSPALPAGWLGPVLAVLLVTYVTGRLCEGYFIQRFGFHLHIWRPFDAFFRLILARRNPNLVLLLLAWLAGRPDVGLVLVAGWTLVTFLVHLGQIAQAELVARRGPVRSFLDTAGNTAGGRAA